MSLATIATIERNETGIAAALGILKQRFGERFQTGAAIRSQHAHTTTYIPNQAPDGVVWPETTEEVQEIVRVFGETGRSLNKTVTACYGAKGARTLHLVHQALRLAGVQWEGEGE